MAEQAKPKTAAEPDKKEQLEATRKRLEQLGVAEDTVPTPDPEQARDMAPGSAARDQGPDQASVQPAAAGLKDAVKKQSEA